MKKSLYVVILGVTASLLLGCAIQKQESSSPLPSSNISSMEVTDPNTTEAASMEPLINSYYAGQSSRAFKMIQKSIFKNILSGWTDTTIKNPIWNYDSFTQYQILDTTMESAAPSEDLYYCTFSADDNKFGYVVVSYNGDSLSHIRVVETPYLYDLQANIETITALLHETELDLPSAAASRIQLVDASKNRSDEIIRIVDGNGHEYLCFFGETSLLLSEGSTPIKN